MLELYAALFAVQQQIEGIVKGNKNTFFKNGTYASRTDILDTLKPLFAEHKLLLMQLPAETKSSSVFSSHIDEKDGDTESRTPVVNLALKTVIVHVPTGQTVEATAIVPMPKPDPQGFGSALTYTSRYSIIAMLALPLLEDDDGNAASPQTTKKVVKKQTPPKQTTPSPATVKDTETSGTSDTQPTPSASTAASTPTSTTTPPVTETSPSDGKPAKRKLWGS